MDGLALQSVIKMAIVAITIIIVAIVVIVALHLVLKNKPKWEKPKECSACKRTDKLHMLYISGILLFLLILTFTYITVNGNQYDKVYNYFSFASVIVSIILAILTIVYSYFTNASSTGQVEKLNKTSEEISTVSTNISEASESISENATKLANNIGEILAQLDEVKQSTASGFEAVNQKFENAMKSVNNDNGELSSKANNIPNDKFTDNFLENCSLMSTCILLACKYYIEKKEKSFNAPDILFEGSVNDNEYMLGFLSTTSAIGFIKYNKSDTSFEIEYLDKYIRSKIEKFLNEKLNRRKNMGDEDSIKFIEKSILKTKAYFGEKEKPTETRES